MPVRTVPFSVQYGEGKTTDATLEYDQDTSGTVGVVLAHGAGGGKDSGHLPFYARKFAEAGFPCVRFTCKPVHIRIRSKAMEAVMGSTLTLPDVPKITSWIVAGHSMGARVASEIAHSDENQQIAGCVFFSYPLHPPGKPDQLRDVPLCSLQLPCFFVRGTADNYCQEDQFRTVFRRLHSRHVQVHCVEGGDHGLKVRGGQAANSNAAEIVMQQVLTFVSAVTHGKETPAMSSADISEVTTQQLATPCVASSRQQHEPSTGQQTSVTKRSRKQDAHKPAKRHKTSQHPPATRSKVVGKPKTTVMKKTATAPKHRRGSDLAGPRVAKRMRGNQEQA